MRAVAKSAFSCSVTRALHTSHNAYNNTFSYVFFCWTRNLLLLHPKCCLPYWHSAQCRREKRRSAAVRAGGRRGCIIVRSRGSRSPQQQQTSGQQVQPLQQQQPLALRSSSVGGLGSWRHFGTFKINLKEIGRGWEESPGYWIRAGGDDGLDGDPGTPPPIDKSVVTSPTQKVLDVMDALDDLDFVETSMLIELMKVKRRRRRKKRERMVAAVDTVEAVRALLAGEDEHYLCFAARGRARVISRVQEGFIGQLLRGYACVVMCLSVFCWHCSQSVGFPFRLLSQR